MAGCEFAMEFYAKDLQNKIQVERICSKMSAPSLSIYHSCYLLKQSVSFFQFQFIFISHVKYFVIFNSKAFFIWTIFHFQQFLTTQFKPFSILAKRGGRNFSVIYF